MAYDVISGQLVGKSRVAEAIEKQTKERLRKVGVHVEKVLTRMAQLAFVDIRNFTWYSATNFKCGLINPNIFFKRF